MTQSHTQKIMTFLNGFGDNGPFKHITKCLLDSGFRLTLDSFQKTGLATATFEKHNESNEVYAKVLFNNNGNYFLTVADKFMVKNNFTKTGMSTFILHIHTVASLVVSETPSKYADLTVNQISVLSCLVEAIEEETDGEWGFVDTAWDKHKASAGSHALTFKMFKDYALRMLNDYIDWSEDLSKDPGVECNSIQFAVTAQTYADRAEITAIANNFAS
jgi:hypothetical protein